ncbi:MAG: AAA family ATPase [Propionibacteriaceae bacterium]|nr:AAA family ATPase [Propionibacteriaceae bacterium]
MRRIAVYGKGGIGKSTVAANLSVALSWAGHRVLQIGCDPKHDSTRLLLQGRRLTTVLDYMRVTGPLERRIEDVLAEGFAGVGCVEAGGPQPGVGCAGRGIISTFTMLDQFRLGERYDLTVYDVLGDVVCGGFAVPIRREYADTILIVTSGEFMALYAANNILRGVRTYDEAGGRVAGIIYNRRNVPGEDERVTRFAAAVQLPVVATIPRSDAFTRAEQRRITVLESAESPQLTALFTSLATRLNTPDLPLYEANPLTDEELENVVLSSASDAACGLIDLPPVILRTVAVSRDSAQTDPATSSTLSPLATQPATQPAIEQVATEHYLSKDVVHREPLHGCAFNGAMCTAAYVSDIIVLAHAPTSCAYLSYQTITSTGRRKLFERGALLPASLSPNLECTNMGEPELVFGGMDALHAKVAELKTRRPKAIVVISSCPAGIIGDDIDRIADLSEPDLPVIPVKTDGNMAGDYLQGMFLAYLGLAREFIKRNVPVVPRSVNIIAEKIVVTNTEDNYRLIASYLASMGISVNCRFLYNTSYKELSQFTSAPLNLLAYDDYTGSTLQRFFESEYGSTFLNLPFPVGFAQTADWLRAVATIFNTSTIAEEIISKASVAYQQQVNTVKAQLNGKRLMVVTYNHELDWILQTALDAGMEIVKVCVLDYSQDDGFRTRITQPFPVEQHYDRTRRAADIAALRPDVLLSNYASSVADAVAVADTIPMCPDVGFTSGLKLAHRWANLLKTTPRGDWRLDRELYNHYYS